MKPEKGGEEEHSQKQLRYKFNFDHFTFYDPWHHYNHYDYLETFLENAKANHKSIKKHMMQLVYLDVLKKLDD